MARRATDSVAGPWNEGRAEGEDYRAYFERCSDALSRLIATAAALPAGEIVGGVVRFQVADGYAFYQVTAAKPLTLAHIPMGDGYQIPDAHLRGLQRADVVGLVNRERSMFEMFGQRKPAPTP